MNQPWPVGSPEAPAELHAPRFTEDGEDMLGSQLLRTRAAASGGPELGLGTLGGNAPGRTNRSALDRVKAGSRECLALSI
jgi:hypothetical protein